MRGQIISEHLFTHYGVRKILLEGISRTLSDKYNSPTYKGRKLSVGTSKSVTFKVWFDLLNKNEYDITVLQRNKVFIDNILETKEPGIVICGGGHVQDLIDQLKKRGVSYLIVVPKGIGWTPARKDDDKIYADMLQLGCQLKKCSLGFGDGGSAQINLPIE
jgi:ABC-type Fe3+-hydroxamate transport system substrate-binding protein